MLQVSASFCLSNLNYNLCLFNSSNCFWFIILWQEKTPGVSACHCLLKQFSLYRSESHLGILSVANYISSNYTWMNWGNNHRMGPHNYWVHSESNLYQNPIYHLKNRSPFKLVDLESWVPRKLHKFAASISHSQKFGVFFSIVHHDCDKCPWANLGETWRKIYGIHCGHIARSFAFFSISIFLILN